MELGKRRFMFRAGVSGKSDINGIFSESTDVRFFFQEMAFLP